MENAMIFESMNNQRISSRYFEEGQDSFDYDVNSSEMLALMPLTCYDESIDCLPYPFFASGDDDDFEEDEDNFDDVDAEEDFEDDDDEDDDYDDFDDDDYYEEDDD